MVKLSEMVWENGPWEALLVKGHQLAEVVQTTQMLYLISHFLKLFVVQIREPNNFKYQRSLVSSKKYIKQLFSMFDHALCLNIYHVYRAHPELEV